MVLKKKIEKKKKGHWLHTNVRGWRILGERRSEKAEERTRNKEGERGGDVGSEREREGEE